MAAVELRDVCKRYDGTAELAVDNVSIRAEQGEFLVLLGPSGCGKSTTLRMIAGLESVSDGAISIGDRVVNTIPAKDRDIAMVFQSYALYPHMSVRRNLGFGLLRRKVSRVEVDERVRKVAEMLGLSELLDRRPGALSGGQRQRVALGRAVVRDPEVFLFDEPLSNLDASLRASTRSELLSLHRRLGTTMIYVTHDQTEAMTMGTRICIMNKGKVAQIGSPLDVYRSPADTFVAKFLGSPPMNLIGTSFSISAGAIEVQINGMRLPLARYNRESLPSLIENKRVVLGVRPEDLYDASTFDSEYKVSGLITAIEPLGAETFLTLRLECGTEIVVRWGRVPDVELGERATVAIDEAAVYLFDATSGKALQRRD